MAPHISSQEVRDLRNTCLNKIFDCENLWSTLPIVIEKELTKTMSKEEILVAELQFSLVATEMLYNKELSELLNIVRKTVKWNDALPKFNRRHLIIILTRLKKHSDQVCHDLGKDWFTEDTIAINLSKIYDCLDFNLDTSFAMLCVAYCDSLEELRTMMRRALSRNNDDVKIAFSPSLNAERALLPLQRLAFHRATLRRISSELPSNLKLSIRCQVTMENISSILDRCYEVLSSLHGSNYVADIDNVMDFSTKLSSLKRMRQKKRLGLPLCYPSLSTSEVNKVPLGGSSQATSSDQRSPAQSMNRVISSHSFNLIDLNSVSELPLGADYTTFRDSSREFLGLPEQEMTEIVLDPKLLNCTSNVILKTFEEGPLYQTYTQHDYSVGDTCKRLSINYESEHIYEEIDGISEPRQTSRTFWCDIDAVVNSGILTRLTSKEKALQESKFEIISSEVSYLKSLCVLVAVFYDSIDLRCTITSEEREAIFANILEVRKVSEKFLYDMAGLLEQDIMMEGICSVVRRHSISAFRVYINYCSNQVKLHRTLSQLMSENEDFRNLIVEMESYSECQGYSLLSFLTLPMQRITRLPLLIQAIQKRLQVSSPEYNVCHLALSALSQLVHECNEALRRSERINNRENLLKESFLKMEKLKNTPRKKKSFLKFIPPGADVFSI